MDSNPRPALTTAPPEGPLGEVLLLLLVVVVAVLVFLLLVVIFVVKIQKPEYN